MRSAFLLVLVGLLMAGYSFVGDAHLWTHWPDIVGTKADIGTSRQRPADVPYDAILMVFHRDWMVVRYFGVATFIVGIAGLFYGRHKPVVQQVAGANRRWRGPFRCRGSRRESAVAIFFR